MAFAIARRDNIVTAETLIEETGCALRTAQKTLRDLAEAGWFVGVVLERKGRRRGDWRNVYGLIKAPPFVLDVDPAVEVRAIALLMQKTRTIDAGAAKAGAG
jgi:hypothetical protein